VSNCEMFRLQDCTSTIVAPVTDIASDSQGIGDKLDMQKGLALRAGGFGAVPVGMRHYGWTDGGTVVQIHGNGPFAITYVNPADDPSKGMTKASD
jgi:hypothetical protein